MASIVITGIGVTSAIGQGKDIFCQRLLQGYSNFSVMQREGRQKDSNFIGAEIPEIVLPNHVSVSLFRNVSFSGKIAFVTLDEAWKDAKLDLIKPERIGLVVGGSNVQQREWILLQEKYRNNPHFIPPFYSFAFMDTDICGFCSELLNIQGFTYTIGGASASGQVAVIRAVQAVLSGEVDVCIALGAVMDVSYFELYALQSLGAMGGIGVMDPQKVCRPFDKDRAGFIFGENCAAVVIERLETAQNRSILPYAQIISWAMSADGNRNPNPSLKGEVKVIKQSLALAKLDYSDIDYVNPHGTGSKLGDEVELKALKECGLNYAYINSTKSITGHGLTSAGTVEIVATLMQMKMNRLHPSLNLIEPMYDDFNWVKAIAVNHSIKNALSLSFGFGGMNTAVCLRQI
ncbi:MAG: polyketide beta-ketoacyl:ACP synthase [Gammaproteobacteria bacterium]|nr:polyketide beta-ketoacyl:ACP synthase [Gammaproteobacteria bacterium]